MADDGTAEYDALKEIINRLGVQVRKDDIGPMLTVNIPFRRMTPINDADYQRFGETLRAMRKPAR